LVGSEVGMGTRSDVFAEEKARWLCDTPDLDGPRDSSRLEALAGIARAVLSAQVFR
jgi:hypothetical protein